MQYYGTADYTKDNQIIHIIYTGWSELKYPYSGLSIHRTTQLNSSKIVEHTIQDMGKWIMRKKLVPKTLISGAVQQKIC